MKHFAERTMDAAKGKWRGILMALGLPGEALVDRHGPCPSCGGKDRFRFDNKGGDGTWFCNVCGAGRGIDLVMRVLNLDFPEAAKRVDGIVGNVTPEAAPTKTEMTDEDRRKALRSVWADSVPATEGDLVHRYLSARGLGERVYPEALRFAARLRDGEGGVRPCMVAVVADMAGKPATLHRTFLRPDGLAKAEMEAPRKLMPGHLPDGACVRLSEWVPGPLGIAEGIETALAASARFGMPVWAAINATVMAKWLPPEGCTEVAIFADNDRKFGGQAAAYRLAHRLATGPLGIEVTVHVPLVPGTDWADVWLTERGTE